MGSRKWVRLGSFRQSSVPGLQSLVCLRKLLRVILMGFEMGSFCIKKSSGKAPLALRIQKSEFRNQNVDFFQMAYFISRATRAFALVCNFQSSVLSCQTSADGIAASGGYYSSSSLSLRQENDNFELLILSFELWISSRWRFYVFLDRIFLF